MLILDTNVVSELMATRPAQRVADWIVAQPSEELFTASVCQAEILAGIGVLPAGRRRRTLEEAARAVFTDDFQGRILPFDSNAATAYADLLVGRRKVGRAIGTIDLMVAAIAWTRGSSVVTRNVVDFEGIGLSIINPWVD